jgi:hypothetical protein
VVKFFLIPNSAQIAKKNFAVNCGPLSVNKDKGGPYEYTQWSQKARATDRAVTVLRGTVFVTFENLSEITRRKRLPCLVLGEGPRMSIATDSRGPLAGNSFNLLV